MVMVVQAAVPAAGVVFCPYCGGSHADPADRCVSAAQAEQDRVDAEREASRERVAALRERARVRRERRQPVIDASKPE